MQCLKWALESGVVVYKEIAFGHSVKVLLCMSWAPQSYVSYDEHRVILCVISHKLSTICRKESYCRIVAVQEM